MSELPAAVTALLQRRAVREHGTRVGGGWTLTTADRRRFTSFALDALTLALVAWVFLTLNKPLYTNYPGYDEEFFTWGGWCITKGLAPYKDFLEFKPPVSFITHAIAIKLFGLNYGFRTFFAIVPLAAALALQVSLIARGIERFLAAALVAGFLWLFMSQTFHDTSLTDCESIGVTYYILGLAAFLWEGRFGKVVTALGGFFMSCAVLSKEPIGGVVLATWFGMFFCRRGPLRERALFFARYSLLGVGAFFLLLSLYMVPTGAMKAYFALMRSYSRIYRDPHTSYCVALGIAHPDDGFGVAWAHIRTTFLNENTLGYLAPLAIPGAIFALQRSFGLFVSLVAATVAGLWASVATTCMWTHYCVMSMAGVLYVLVVGADSLRWPLGAASRRVRFAVSAAALVFIAAHLWPTLEQYNRERFVRIPWREPQPGLLAFIARNTKPSDRIFTTGTPQLYARADRVSAVRETNIIDEILPSYEGATDEERLRPLYQQLVRNRPAVVFLDPENEWRKGRHLQTLVWPFLERFHYRKINDRLYVRP